MSNHGSEPDVVQLLTSQHQRIKAMFQAVTDAPDASTKQTLFNDLRTLLAAHETAEELITHPRARMAEGGNAIVDARLGEEHAAKQTLARLDRTSVGDPDFDVTFDRLRADVLAHAEAEEREEFPLLQRANDPAMLARMATAVRAVEAVAPTRPHPSAGESMIVNAMVGPIASIVDRTRDAVEQVLRR